MLRRHVKSSVHAAAIRCAGVAIHRRTSNVCGRYVVKTPIKTIAKMHRVFDVPLF